MLLKGGAAGHRKRPFLILHLMEQIPEIIKEHARATGNLSGISPVQVSNRAQLPVGQTKQILNRMHAEKRIRVREGINGRLVFGV